MNSTNETEKLLRLVNSSGFPFQLRVAEDVRSMSPDRGWHVISEEYPWNDLDSGSESFVDLILGCSTNYDVVRMIIECKRTRDADWIFLLPDTVPSATGLQTRCMWTSTGRHMHPDKIDLRGGYNNFYIAPESHISEFCIVRGTGEGQKPMLENLCGILLRSVEAIAQEDSSVSLAVNRSQNRYFVPMIVTNARLHICKFNLRSVSLSDGEIPQGDFEEVPFIRFTKNLTVGKHNPARQKCDRARTVLVVQASSLVQLLSQWRLVSGEPVPGW